MKKRIVSLLLALCLAFGMAVPAFGAEEEQIASEDLRSVCGDCLSADIDPTVDFESDVSYVPESSICTAEERAAAIAAYHNALGTVLMAAPQQTVMEEKSNCDPMALFTEAPLRLMAYDSEVRPAGEQETYLDALREQAPVAYLIYLDVFDELSAILRGEQEPVVGQGSGTYYTLSLPGMNSSTYSAKRKYQLLADNYAIAVSAFFADRPLESASCYMWKVGIRRDDDVVTLQMYVYEDPISRYDAMCAACGDFYAGYCAYGLDGDGVDAVTQYRYIHDYLCARLWYNNDHNKLSGSVQWDTHSAYGVLCGLGPDNIEKGHVVCEGYTRAFQLLCQVAGLPCTTVIGVGSKVAPTVDTDANHIWNAVKLSGSWYAIDVTWDDSDHTAKAGSSNVSADFWCYKYFLDNRYFLSGSKRNHWPYSQLMLTSGSFDLSAPAMETAPAEYPCRPTGASWIVLTLSAGEGVTPILRDAETYLRSWTVNGIELDTIPNVRCILTGNTQAGETLEILTGKRWVICSDTDGVTITRKAGFTGRIFNVSAGAALTLENLTVDGEGRTATAPLIDTAEAVFAESVLTSRAYLELRDTLVCGSRGAAGIEMNGYCVLWGATRVMDNFSDAAGNRSRNLSIGGNGWLCISGSLCPETTGVIGITAAADALCGSLWAENTADSLSVLRGDGARSCVPDTDPDRFGIVLTGNFSLTAAGDALPQAEGRLLLANGTGEDRIVCVIFAAYGPNRRQQSASILQENESIRIALMAGESVYLNTQSVPDCESVTVFVMDGNTFAPIACETWA